MILTRLRRYFSLYHRAFQYVNPHKRLVFIGMLLAVVLSLLNGVATYSLLPVFDIVFHVSGQSGQVAHHEANTWGAHVIGYFTNLLGLVAGEGSLLARAARLVFFITGLSVASSVLAIVSDYLFASAQALAVRDLSAVMFYHLSRLPFVFYANSRTGELISRTQTELGGTVSMVARNVADLVTGALSAIVFFLLLLFVSPILVIVVIPVLGVIVGAMGILGWWMKRRRISFLTWQAVITGAIHEFFSGIKIIKLFGAEDKEHRQWRDKADVSRRYEVINSLSKMLPLRFAEVMAMVVSAAVLLAGTFFITRNILTLSELFLFFVVLIQFQRPVNTVTRAWVSMQQGRADAERTFALLDMAPESQNEGTPLPTSWQALVFDRVSFRYNDGQPLVLNDISFEIKQGNTVALVGLSGSGKSTLVDLLLRFYQPSEGHILLDETNIGTLSLSEYRTFFGVVTQDTFLFNDTVKNNIAYSLSKPVSDQDVEAAAVAAYADGFIRRLAHGYDTTIGERGVLLSGGQRQRLALARALIRKPEVLILDEATSALDSKSERQVQAAFDALVGKRTILVIAHRLSTIVRADHIVVLNEGKIVEQGTHQQLLASDGLYRHLWNLQVFQ